MDKHWNEAGTGEDQSWKFLHAFLSTQAMTAKTASTIAMALITSGMIVAIITDEWNIRPAQVFQIDQTGQPQGAKLRLGDCGSTDSEQR